MKKLILISLIIFSSVCIFGQARFPISNSSHLAVASANLITNGTFDTDTDWVKETGAWTISSGTANYDDSGSSIIGQTDAVMAGAIQASTDYTVEFDIVISSGTASLSFRSYDGGAIYDSGTTFANGSHSYDFTTPSSGILGFGIRASSSSTTSFTLDNVVLTER